MKGLRMINIQDIKKTECFLISPEVATISLFQMGNAIYFTLIWTLKPFYATILTLKHKQHNNQATNYQFYIVK